MKIVDRVQEIADHPSIVPNRARNPDATRQPTETISKLPCNKVITVLGSPVDKSVSRVAKIYQRVADKTIIITPDCPTRALDVSELKPAPPRAIIADNPRKGLVVVKKIMEPSDLIITTGSFYTIKDIGASLDEK